MGRGLNLHLKILGTHQDPITIYRTLTASERLGQTGQSNPSQGIMKRLTGVKIERLHLDLATIRLIRKLHQSLSKRLEPSLQENQLGNLNFSP